MKNPKKWLFKWRVWRITIGIGLEGRCRKLYKIGWNRSKERGRDMRRGLLKLRKNRMHMREYKSRYNSV